MSEPLYDQVILTTNDSTVSRVMLGSSVDNLNAGVTTSQQGLLLPASLETTLPTITAEVRYRGVPLDPQPWVLWELSCGANIATIKDGVITRQTNPNASSFDSNGGVSTGQIGSLIQVSATVLRADGSQSGVRGTINVTIQAQAARQFGGPTQNGGPAASNSPLAVGFYDLVD
jgi:hypothetical protein